MDVNRTEVELESLVNRIERNELDLQPSFQRGEIWDLKRRQRLIDSILRGWYVPAVHIVEAPLEIEAVLDGQQRLATVRDFFRDVFAIDGRLEPRHPDIERLDGLRFSELPEVTRKAIQRFPMAIVRLKNFDPQEPNELFFRLNQSYNLTPPEKRNALHGPARTQIRELVDALAEAGLLAQNVVGFNNARLAYDDIVARTCLAVQRRNIRTHINNNVVEHFYRESRFSEETLRNVYHAGVQLRNQIEAHSSRVRLNKATLFSWLVFLIWVPEVTGVDVPVDFFANFENLRNQLRQGEDASVPSSPLRLYEDRSSYRVTDVSSVVARDLALALMLACLHSSVRLETVRELLLDITFHDDPAGQRRILDYATSSSWGDWDAMVGG